MIGSVSPFPNFYPPELYAHPIRLGAPWGWRGYPTIPWGGNGGFSLRRRSRMLDLTERFTEDWERERPAEDYWFAHKLEETTTAFPETDFAMSFAFVRSCSFFLRGGLGRES